MTQQKDDATPELSEDCSASSEADLESIPTLASSQDRHFSSDDDDAKVLADLRPIIAKEMCMAVEEIADTINLSTIEMNSLMNLTIIGALREKTSLLIPLSLFVDNRPIEDIRWNLGLDSQPAPQPEPVALQVAEVFLKGTSRQRSATSVLLRHGGWSAGGIVALEVMRQLQAMKKVAP